MVGAEVERGGGRSKESLTIRKPPVFPSAKWSGGAGTIAGEGDGTTPRALTVPPSCGC